MVNQREENIYTDSISKTKHLKGPWDTVRGNHDSTMSSSGASLWLDGTAKQELEGAARGRPFQIEKIEWSNAQKQENMTLPKKEGNFYAY